MIGVTRKLSIVGLHLCASTALFARPMTPEDIARLEFVGEIAVPPVGNEIAFATVTSPDVTMGAEDGPPQNTINIATGPDRFSRFLPSGTKASQIAFTPDRAMLSYVLTEKGAGRTVWGVPVNGGASQKIAEIKGESVNNYVFSGDGRTLYAITEAAQNKTRDAEAKRGFDAIIYEEEAQLNKLYEITLDGMKTTAQREIPVAGYVTRFIPVPGGKTGIILAAPSPQIDDEYTSKKIQVIDLKTGKVNLTIGTQGKLDDVELSGDGKSLSIIAGVDKNDPAATTLYRVDLATGAMLPLNAGAREAAADAEFLSNGKIAAIIHKGSKSLLRIYGQNGFEEIDAGGLILTSIDCNGENCAFTANSPQHPSELFVLKNGKFIRWTNHNAWLKDIDFGRQTALTYTARDGTEIEGILIEPVGPKIKGGAATIMAVHGGPESHYSNGWLTNYAGPGQLAAGQGYAVFHPNYRGSTAYGTAFSKSHQNDYAGKEFDDIVDAKRALVAKGITDPNRTGITGGSYGGYASAWGATAQSAEFAASVMFVGLSDLVSKFGTTDIPWEMYNVHSLKWPWDDWMRMIAASPISHVNIAETPLLILHGDKDTRVSPTQSYELYRHMKVRKPKTPVRLVLYPGEGHGNRRAASRYDYTLRMMQWFDTYLKTGNRTAPLPPSRPALVNTAQADENANK